MQDYPRRHDLACKQLLEACEHNWNIEDRLSHEKVAEICTARDVKVEVDKALQMVTGACGLGVAQAP